MNDLFATTEKDQIIEAQKQEIEELRSRLRSPDAKPWSHYQQIKKDNPTEYWSGKVQAQMFEDARTLDDKFMDGDYLSDKFRESNIVRSNPNKEQY
jgi:hypothetical protein